MQTAKNLRFTYHDYLLLPEDKRYELIDGDFFMTPSPISKHQKIAANLVRKLDRFIEEKKIGKLLFAPLDVVLSEEDVVQPDILFVSQEHMGRIKEKNIMGPPDLVIEILSPASEERDRVIKRKLYGRYGVRELWIVDPESRTIEVIGWQGSEFKTLQIFPDKTILKSFLVEGLTVSLADIFESL